MSGYVYILCNKRKTVFYTGVTGDLRRRVQEHKDKIIKGFTEKYNVDQLLFWESLESIEDAISREKQIKGYSRNKKIDLIQIQNADLLDLSKDILNS